MTIRHVTVVEDAFLLRNKLEAAAIFKKFTIKE